MGDYDDRIKWKDDGGVNIQAAMKKAADSIMEGLRVEARSKEVFERAESFAHGMHAIMAQTQHDANRRTDGDWPHTRVAKWWRRRKCERAMTLHAAAAWFHERAAQAYKTVADTDPPDLEPPNGSSH